MKWIVVFLFGTFTAFANVHYVDHNNASPSSPYTNWASAAASIEDAIFEATDGDTVLVAPGTYFPREREGIEIISGITVQSLEGPHSTIINGGNYGRGFKSFNPNTVISGFTVTRGKGMYYDIWEQEWQDSLGGGILCDPFGGSLITNCIIRECQALDGGGLSGGRAVNCEFIGNIASVNGGGMMMGIAHGCLFQFNHAGHDGGGASECKIFNCTIVENTCGMSGGGVNGEDLFNSIVFYNLNINGNIDDNIGRIDDIHFSCSPDVEHGVDGNITNAPSFINRSGRNYRLATDSPCVDAGLSAYAVELFQDLDGKPRILNTRVDMGAYEYQAGSLTDTMHVKATLQRSGNLSDWMDTDHSIEWSFPRELSNQFYRAKLRILD